MDTFDALTNADLQGLAEALRAGRLSAPFTAVAVRRYCPASRANAVAERLQQLHADGMQSQHLALLVETVARTRLSVPPSEEMVDLVWTGPETLGVTNRDTSVVVRDLFAAAETEVLIAGFAVHQGRAVFKRLAERMEERPGLQVKLFLDVHRSLTDESRRDDVLRAFVRHFRTEEWPGERLPNLFYDPRSLEPVASKRSSLHAKCVVVDRRLALVTSANFTEAAQTRNIEVGALIRCDRFAAKVTEHFEALVSEGALTRASFVSGSANGF
jgi:phosphatidylserine/phosphatidylglycerophosphate/cardiolipin synthase-like enzyme